VRGGEHVEHVSVVENLEPRLLQLESHADGQDGPDHAGDHREHEIHRADVFVVGGIDEAAPTGRNVMRVVMGLVCPV
jgi:hypothetical protein